MFEDIPALCPVQFFGLACDCSYLKGALKKDKRFQLPATADLLDEETFADVYSAWNVEKLAFLIDVRTPFQKVGEGDIRKGDSIELFIDTRDLKSKGVVSRFCHHFVFYPAQIDGFYGREVTRFRNEDIHRLCHPEDLQIEVNIGKNGYQMEIEIPAHCLFGFDPLSFPRIGFTYRINRAGAPAQHFAVSSQEYAIEQHPALWGTLTLQREGD
jgi:hypothetical protein